MRAGKDKMGLVGTATKNGEGAAREVMKIAQGQVSKLRGASAALTFSLFHCVTHHLSINDENWTSKRSRRLNKKIITLPFETTFW